MPSNEFRSGFSNVIEKLADQFHSVGFEPHITLASVPDWPKQKMTEKAGQIARMARPFSLKTSKVHCKSNPYQKLTLEIKKSDELERFHKLIDTVLEGDYSKKAYPHLSLLYSKLNCDKIHNHLTDIDLTYPAVISCNRLALLRCKGTPQNWEMLYSWELSESNH